MRFWACCEHGTLKVYLSSSMEPASKKSDTTTTKRRRSPEEAVVVPVSPQKLAKALAALVPDGKSSHSMVTRTVARANRKLSKAAVKKKEEVSTIPQAPPMPVRTVAPRQTQRLQGPEEDTAPVFHMHVEKPRLTIMCMPPSEEAVGQVMDLSPLSFWLTVPTLVSQLCWCGIMPMGQPCEACS